MNRCTDDPIAYATRIPATDNPLRNLLRSFLNAENAPSLSRGFLAACLL